MRKIKYKLEIGFVGCEDEGETEVEDNMSDAEIDELVDDMARDHASSWESDERLYSEEEWEEMAEYDCEPFYENVYGSWKFV